MHYKTERIVTKAALLLVGGIIGKALQDRLQILSYRVEVNKIWSARLRFDVYCKTDTNTEINVSVDFTTALIAGKDTREEAEQFFLETFDELYADKYETILHDFIKAWQTINALDEVWHGK